MKIISYLYVCSVCICEMDIFLKLVGVPFATRQEHEIDGSKVISGGMDL